MNDACTAIVINLAKKFIELTAKTDPKWEKAYFRFHFESLRYGSKCSYSIGQNGFMFDIFKDSERHDELQEISVELVRELQKPSGLFLLTVDNSFNYNISFEWSNLDKWEISKISGGSGIPTDIDLNP